ISEPSKGRDRDLIGRVPGETTRCRLVRREDLHLRNPEAEVVTCFDVEGRSPHTAFYVREVGLAYHQRFAVSPTGKTIIVPVATRRTCGADLGRPRKVLLDRKSVVEGRRVGVGSARTLENRAR